MKKIYLAIFGILFVFVIGGCANKENESAQSVATREITEKLQTGGSGNNKADDNFCLGNVKSDEKEKEENENNNRNKSKQEVSDGTMVDVTDYISDIEIDLKYSTTDNFTGAIIYDFKQAYLRYGTVKKLKKVQDTLREENLSLKIWDAYRPVRAQFRLWEVCPDSTYVANPNKGFSSHSRGNTVDVTLITTKGKKVDMPTGFDDFTKKADRDFSDCSKEETQNAKLLEEVMETSGFTGYFEEWWHFSDTVSYSVKKDVKNLK